MRNELNENLLPKDYELDERRDSDNKFNQEKEYSVDSDFFQEAFGIGKITQVVLEELTDEQDYFEAFFTVMFMIGCFFIPFTLIFSDYIKPYDIDFILIIQNSSLYSNEFFKILGSFINYFYSLNFHMSFTIFIYLAIDPGIGFKVAMTAGFLTYISYFLEIIIHDNRPYWHNNNIKPVLCHMTFGCPSINVLSGLLYYNLLNFYLSRAIKSKDPILDKNLIALSIGSFIAKVYIVINILVALILIANGENYIYQIIVTFLIGFILVRILIAFNKEIDYHSNGARYVLNISNYTVIWVFIYVLGLACLSWIIYSSVYESLQISKESIKIINVIFII